MTNLNISYAPGTSIATVLEKQGKPVSTEFEPFGGVTYLGYADGDSVTELTFDGHMRLVKTG